MLHGFADTGDMWAPLAAALVHDHTVIVPDLRGMGLCLHLGRYEVHLDRKLERMLAMLLRLKELRQGPVGG